MLDEENIEYCIDLHIRDDHCEDSKIYMQKINGHGKKKNSSLLVMEKCFC